MKPCAFYDWDDAAARDRLAHPTDSCQMQCGICGFNPNVADRRIERWRREWQRNSKNLNARFA